MSLNAKGEVAQKKVKEERDRILVRMNKELSGKVREAAICETRSINSFIVAALKAYLSWKFEGGNEENVNLEGNGKTAKLTLGEAEENQMINE